MKRKEYTIPLSEKDSLDIMLEVQNKVIRRFALNYRALINNEWKEVYRIDNFHGFLHHQRFWRSPKPIPIDHHEPILVVIESNIIDIKENFRRYRLYFERSKK